MKTNTQNTRAPAEICEITAQGGKMMNEHCELKDSPQVAPAVRHGAISRAHIGGTGHSRNADVNDNAQSMIKDGAEMTKETTTSKSLGLALDAAKRPSVEVDVAKYQAYLDDPGLSQAQKEEIIQALWSILVAFVDLGFGVHPAQEACGQLHQSLDEKEKGDSNETRATHTKLRQEFNAASGA